MIVELETLAAIDVSETSTTGRTSLLVTEVRAV
jgi:hypothetical protein